MASPELKNIKFEHKQSLSSKLLDYENKMKSDKYKFGLIYAKNSNQTEHEMFSNSILNFFLKTNQNSTFF